MRKLLLKVLCCLGVVCSASFASVIYSASGIKATAVPKQTVAKDTLLLLSSLEFSDPSIDARYLQGKTIVLITHINENYSEFTDKDVIAGAKDMGLSLQKTLCDTKKKYKSVYDLYSGHTLKIIVNSRDNVNIGVVSIQLDEIKC
ncbi:hypothetical protein [Fangia hongkongensis]|uniref:hypothetical protein n=1 Tax=Fangia hongkongensis TaxID=270495 RepID=UPI00036D8D89|nr:hypothetical protein [Fangia hongkongensis]MBK2124776.1 hypothetical protein [Fangia hongkongensis]